MVSIRTTIRGLEVRAPYNAIFVRRAKELGGRWLKPAWVFDARVESRVRGLCKEVYGTDGDTSDLVTLQIRWREGEIARQAPIEVAGHTVARAFGRDSGARLGPSVILLEGGFSSGGSHKNWTTRASAGTVVQVLDFPRATAERLVASQEADDLREYSIVDPRAQ